MNQKIEQNRTAIVEAAMSITKILTSIVNLGVTTHQAQIDLQNSSNYSTEFVQDKIKQFDAQCRAAAEAYEPKLTSELEDILAAGKLLENSLEITDSDLASALAIIEASQGELDIGTGELIVSTFKGNQRALSIIRGVLQRFGKKTTTLDKFIFEIDYKMTSLRGHVSLITSDPYNNGADIMGMRRDLINLCKVIGEEVPEEKFDLGENYDALQTARMRKAAGLPAK